MTTFDSQSSWERLQAAMEKEMDRLMRSAFLGYLPLGEPTSLTSIPSSDGSQELTLEKLRAVIRKFESPKILLVVTDYAPAEDVIYQLGKDPPGSLLMDAGEWDERWVASRHAYRLLLEKNGGSLPANITVRLPPIELDSPPG